MWHVSGRQLHTILGNYYFILKRIRYTQRIYVGISVAYEIKLGKRFTIYEFNHFVSVWVHVVFANNSIHSYAGLFSIVIHAKKLICLHDISILRSILPTYRWDQFSIFCNHWQFNALNIINLLIRIGQQKNISIHCSAYRIFFQQKNKNQAKCRTFLIMRNTILMKISSIPIRLVRNHFSNDFIAIS